LVKSYIRVIVHFTLDYLPDPVLFGLLKDFIVPLFVFLVLIVENVFSEFSIKLISVPCLDFLLLLDPLAFSQYIVRPGVIVQLISIPIEQSLLQQYLTSDISLHQSVRYDISPRLYRLWRCRDMIMIAGRWFSMGLILVRDVIRGGWLIDCGFWSWGI
jgi:hypothetical protein